MPHRKYISLISSPIGGGESVALQLRKWQFWTLIGGVLLGWLFLLLSILGIVFFARTAVTQRALVAENSRLRLALAKADSLRQELDEIRAMRRLMERALLVADKKAAGGVSSQVVPSWVPKSSVFVPQHGLPELTEYLENLARTQAYVPTELPAKGVITAKFGEVGAVFKSPHSGVDILLKKNSPVYATADGIIACTEENEKLGKFVEIDHLNGYRTIYAHLSDIVISPGDPIRRDDMVGHSGETGRAHHAHLHYEVHYEGKPIDPLTIISAQKGATDTTTDTMSATASREQ